MEHKLDHAYATTRLLPMGVPHVLDQALAVKPVTYSLVVVVNKHLTPKIKLKHAYELKLNTLQLNELDILVCIWFETLKKVHALN